MRRGGPAPRAAAGGDPRPAGERSPVRLPLAVDSFVAREAEMADLSALLAASRLVTVTGPSGVGKTRLALEVASADAGEYPDGAVFAALAGTGDVGLLAQAVASALSVGEQAGRPLLDTVVDHLRHSRLLLVLDNCEHVVAGAARLVDTLLRACAGLTVLATSQEPLAIAGETVLALAPLGVPGDDGDAMEASPAVRLFCERAGVIRPGFTLTPEVAPAVAEICRRLDGVALAIELAAARVAVLSPAEIAARLSDRFGLLTGGSRVGPPRHKSLQAALDWSHELCSGRERALLRRLSVFAGGATLDAVAGVCAGGELAPREVLDTIAALAARSLVAVVTTGPVTRYRMLETVRAYAADRLAEAGESPDVARRHAEWFTALAESAEPGLTGSDQQCWLERLDADHANLRAALDWAAADGDPVLALRLSGALTLWWRVRGYFSEGRGYLDAALARDAGAPAEVRAKALWGAGFLALMLGDTAVAMAALPEAADLYRSVEDLRGWARSVLLLANCVIYFDPLGAQPLLEQSAALAREAGDDWCLVHALALGGLSHHLQCEPAAARPLLDQAVAVARRSRDDQGLRIAYAVLGELALSEGDHDTAEEALNEVLSVTRRLGESYGAGVALVGLGEVALARGDHDAAFRALEEGEAAGRATASPGITIGALSLQAQLAQAEGDDTTAARLYDEAISVAAGVGSDSISARRGLGEVAAARRDPVEAERLFEEALALARDARNDREVAAILYDLGNLARSQGGRERALTFHHQALEQRQLIGDVRGLIESLEALGGLALDAARPRGAYAARLLGAAEHLRGQLRYERSPRRSEAHAAELARLEACMGADERQAAWAQGGELSVAGAVAYATKGRGSRSRSANGWPALTRAEREVAALAAAGLSNPEIAERLFITTWTVKGHLKRVFAKLGITSRVDLALRWPTEPTASSA